MTAILSRHDPARKNNRAMKNEALAKFVAHNICVVHRSHIELGIEPVFWDDEEKEEGPMILSMRREGAT